MKVKLLIVLFTLLFFSCSNNELNLKKRILVLVENGLIKDIQKEIDQFETDLMDEGYLVSVHSSEISKDTPPEEIRSFLQLEYENDNNLSGSVFIGNLRAPLFNRKQDQGDPYWHDYLNDFYFMDLDGIWEDSDDNGVYDFHKETEYGLLNKLRRKLGFEDIRKPEIWVSRIRADKLNSIGNEVDLIKSYLVKNHNYRTKNIELPPKRAFVVSAGVNFKKSDWGASPDKIYSDISVEQFHDSLGSSLKKFLASEIGYEWGVINVFSGPRIHHFNHFNNEINQEWWNSKKGRGLIAEYSDKINDMNDISWQDIKRIRPNVLFYHLFTSEVGRHDYIDYLGGMYLFSGNGLAAVAGTQHSGSVGNPILYEKLSEDNSIGDSWKSALDWLVENSEEKLSIFYFPNTEQIIKAGKSTYKAVLLGDGTLKLPQNKGK